MRLETFSYLPALSDAEVEAQVRSILDRDLVVAIEHTPRVDPRDHYWTLWGLPLFDVHAPSLVLAAIEECISSNPGHYVRINGYDARRQGQVASFVVHRPPGAM